MSKSTKIIDKNNKKSYSKAKKVFRNNYKIEPLEPRLMMDAAIDYAQFVDNYDQVDSIVETQLNSLQSPDLSDLGIEGRIQSIKDSLGDLGSDAETALGSLYAQLTSRLQLMAEDQGVLKDDQNNIVSVDAQTLKNTLNQLFIENSDQLASLNIGYEATQNGFKLTYSPEAELIALPQEGLSSGGYISGVGSNNNLGASAKLDIVFDLSDADGNGLVDSVEPASVVVRDVKAIIENVGGTAKFMNLSVSEESDSDTDLLLKYSDNASGTSSAVHLEFSVDASSNDNFPFAFLGNIGVDKEETGAISVSVPEMQLKNDPQFEIFSLEKALNTISSSFSTIPFIRDFEFGPEENKKKIVEYVENLQEYWADVALAINGAIKNVENTSNYSLDLNNVKSFFDIILPNAQTVLSSVLGNLKLEDANGQEINFLESVTTSLNAVNLSTTTPTSLYLTLSPKIENIAGSLNFGLLELSGLDVDCAMSVKLDVRVDANDNTLIFDGFSLDKFNLTVSKEGIEDPLSLGLFSATVVNGNFKLEVKYDSNNGRGLEADPTFTVESLILKSGAVEVAKLPQKENDVYRFGYDSLTENWIVPDEIKAFASLSGETLSHQVVAYLQSMQTALRKQLEDNVKMDFLGGSVGSVVDVIDKIDKVINGFENPADQTKNIKGLLTIVDGSKYKANFSSVEEFVLVFNEAWKKVFELKQDVSVCDLYAVDSIKSYKMNVEPGDAPNSIVVNCEEDLPTDFDFKNFKLVFNLSFTESKDFDLNLVKSFGPDFANVSTYGNVSATCSAGISFSLDVNFEYQTINDGNGDEDATTLEDIFGANYVANNETCYESIVFDSLSFNPTRTDVKLDDVPMPTFAFTFKVDDNLVLVNSDDIKTSPFKYVDKVDGKENEFVSLTATSLPMIEYNENIKKLIITSDNKFDIESSGNADAFSELKLVNTMQQTCFAASFGADSTLTLALCGVGNETNVEINLNKNKILGFASDLKNKGMSDTDDWEKCLDKYLSLQKSEEDQFGLNDVLSTGSLKVGRSIKNTYGLYVVDINESTGEILFGCDPSLIKGYKTKRDGNEIKIDSDYYTLELNSGFKYMRMSGVLNASGAIGNVAIEVSIPSLPDGISIEVDSKNCLTLENLADKIYETIKNTDVDSTSKLSNFVKSVVVINDKIVFSVTDGVSISSSKLGISNASLGDSGDFKVIYTGGPVSPVDFETLCSGLTKATSVVDVVEAINNIINPKAEGSTERDSTKPMLYWKDADGNAMDHLEFRSKSEFSLVNVGASKVLEMLGFTAMKSSCCGENDYRIVGRTLLGIDWSKLFGFTENAEIKFRAGLDFSIGKKIEFVGDVNVPNVDYAEITLKDAANQSEYAVGGYVKYGEVYFKIDSFVYDDDGNITIINVSRKNVLTLEDNVSTDVDWHAADIELSYVAAVDATFAFIDASLVAQGNVHADIEFSANKKNSTDTSFKENDSFLSNWDFTASCDATSGQFVIGGVVNALGKTVYLGDNTIKLVSENNDLPSIETDFDEFTSAITSEFASLSNFSVQDVYALLDGLVGRLTEIAKNSNVKIPVINKSVGDLVNVANDIRDIVDKLRSDNITSLQGLSDRLNKYLTDFKLMVPQNLPQELEQSVAQTARAFDIKVVGTDIVFDINISKAFSAVHQFNFGGTTGGISGNANLKVTGDFWFNVSAKMTTGDSFDFILEDSVKFGANVNIVGEKLSFNLGIDGGTSNIEGFDALLKNLITVGSDKASSFVVGKAALVGEFGKSGLSLASWKENNVTYRELPSFVVPMSIFGNLPISVCGYELGCIKFGKWNENNGEIICADDIDGLEGYLSQVIGFANDWLSNHNMEPTGSVNVVARKTQNISELGLPAITLLLKEQQKVDIDSDTLVVDVSGVYERIAALVDGNLDWFDKIKLAVTGLNNLLDSLESSINSGMMTDIKGVPVVGNALSGGVDFLSKLKQQILEPFSNFVYESTGMTAEMVAQKLNGLFGSYAQDFLSSTSTLLTKLTDDDGWHKEGKGVYYRQDGESAEWFFTLGGTYSFGSDIGLDLGFPGLGLETNAGVDLSLEWKLNFGMKVSKDGGFQFIFYDENDVSVEVKAGMNGKVLGKMAGLGVELDLDSLNKSSNASQYEKGVDLKFGLDIDHESLGNDLVNVNLSDILGQLPTFTPSATVNMVVGLKVGIVSDIKGDVPKFPNIEGQFEFVWSKDGGIEVLGFNDFQLDMGSFIGGVLGPIVSKIQKVVEPLKPLIDFLTTPFPVLDDLGVIITPLSLAKQYCKGEFSDGMVYAIKDLIALSETISGFSNDGSLKINLGSMPLIGYLDSGDKDTVEKFVNGKMSVSDFGDVLESGGYVSILGSAKSDVYNALSGEGFKMEGGGWDFIWDEPRDIFKLLLGQDIDLVHYNMPKLSFDFDWDTFIRIWAPLGVRLGVSFNASIDLAFGYDTLGIRQWVGSDYKDFSRLLNGFYVDDLDDAGNDKRELSFYGGLKASAELNAGVSAGVGGGVGINVGFNLFDPNKDGKVRLNEIERIFKEEGLFGMFDVEGKITAKLYAYLDLLFYTKKWNITDDITLFEFNYEHTVKPIMISKSGDDVVANIGSNSSSRMSTDDVNKSLDDGDETLDVTISNGNEIADGKHSETVEGNGKFIVNAENGNDKVIISSIDDADFDIVINGGDGDDYIDLSGLTMTNGHVVYINGGAGVDTIIGAQGLNIIFGDTGVIRIDDEKDEQGNHKEYRFVAEAKVDANKAGGDIILGGSGSDIIFGGAGNDQIDGGKGSDYIFGDGGTWSSTVLDAAWNAISDDDKKNMTLEELALRVLQENEKLKANVLDRNSIHITHTEIGLDGGNDTLIGGDDDDEIHGGGGDDRIDGGAGNDLIYGEKGHDRIMGGSGNDTIHGGEGMDIVFGDRIAEGSKNVAKPFDVNISSVETSVAAFSQEFIDAQFKKNNERDTEIKENEFKIKLVDESGKSLTPYVNELKEKYQKDSEGISDSNLVNNDLIQQSFDSLNTGDDIIYGDDGNDLLFGDDGRDTAVGGADKIFGGIGNDIIDGDGGADTISGGIDNDLIYGGAGDDIIDGGAGNDMLYGDNGVTDYLPSSIADGNELTAQPGVDDKIVFGDNYGLHGEIYANAKSQTAGGNDKITTGPGMDFVDGQRGNDKVFVNLMGDSTTNYANVTDSGEDEGEINTLTVEGTENNDLLLMRRSTDGKLGFVALLPNSGVDGSMNSNIERVNFTRNVNAVNLNANGGDDKIFVDGTAKKTNIDAGAGDDEIHIGQVYKSKRDGGDYAEVAEDDHFETVETDDGLFLSTGVTKDTSLNVEGGLGTDNFISLNNVGRLSMNGGRGNDNFTIYGFSDVNGDVIEKGSNSIDGGEGDDSLFVRGTNGDDTVVVTKDGTLSNMVGVKAAGVEKTTFDAAGGDDMFYVLGSREDQVTELNGGKGNDTFTTGGLDEDKVLRSSETDGQACYVEYEVLTSDGLDATQQAARDTAFDTAKVIADKFNIVDTSNVPAVFITDSDNRICSDISINEGTASDFYVRYAGDIKGGSIKVTLGAPVLSNTAFMQGDRGVMIALVDGNENVVSYGETVSFTLDSTHQSFHVRVIAFKDKLAETESVKSISVESFWTRTEQNESVTTALRDSVSALAVSVGNSADSASNQLLCYSEEFRYTGSPVQLGEWAKGLPQGYTMQVCAVGEDGVKSSTLNTTTGLLTINDPNCKGKTLVVNVRSNSMRIDGSKAILAYDEILSLTVKYNGKDVPVAGTTPNTTGIYYKQNGNVLVFYNADNNRFVTLHGTLTVTGTIASSTNSASEPPATPTEPQNMSPAVVVSSHADTLVEYASDSHNSVQCSVGLNQTVAAGKTVYVKVSTKDLAFAKDVLEQDGSLKKNKQVTLSAEGVTPESDGSLILAFTSEKTTYTVTVSAIADAYREDYGLTTVTAGNDKTIAEIDGPVYAYGEGKSIDVDLDNPELLKYEHKIQASTQNVDASDYNEKNNYDMGSLFVARSVAGNIVSIALSDNQDLYASIFEKLEMDVTDEATFFKKTLKFIPTGAGTVEESGWFQIEDCSIADGVVSLTLNDACGDFSESNSKIMLSGNKDYLFQDEATMVDRLFVNNQDDKNAKTSSLNAFTSMTSGSSMVVETENQVPDFDAHAVRFNHSDLAAEGIAAVQMEYAEYNLGTGSDTVNINKTLYREDGFQTFTVVNTGSGATGGDSTDDTVNVNSYAEETATVIASGTSAILSEAADNGGATYAYTLTGSAEALAEAKGALDDSEKIYVDATLSDGTIQRREVTEFESDCFAVKRAFTLASGVSVVSVSFKHGYSGDGQLVVNAQGGDDIINATSNAVTRNDMVVFGGLGDDTINMNRGGIAFGDRGQVLYGEDPQNPVTVLGSTNSGLDYTTGISKNHGDDTASNGPVHRLQTDGVRRGAYEIHSMNDDEGGVDIINVGGTDSVVIGGAAGDTITVSGSNNIALGDNGSVKYYNATNMGAVYGDSLNLGLHTVETTSDSVGDVDTVTISGDKNVAMGGAKSDSIHISGSDNVAIGDGGRYTVTSERLYAESKNEGEGGKDYISTGDGKNAIIGGTDKDTIRTGTGNDAIVGDGGKVIMDLDRNALMVTNEGFNVGEDLGTAGADDIDAGDGDNVIFGGLGNDDIRTGRGKDVVFGDNGFATFRGNASEALSQVHDTLAVPEIRNEATLSFNFVGNAQTGLSSEVVAGALNASHNDDFRSDHWNNIGGTLSGTYGNDDREIVRFDDGTRASAVSVSYGGIERHRTTGTDNRINLQGYSHNFANSSTDANAALMNSGLMTTAPNSQNENKLEVSVDGLAQYFTHYSVIVYLDLPDSNSADTSSIRKVSLFLEDEISPVTSYFVNDAANHNFNGSYDRGTATSAELATSANYVVFDVAEGTSIDRFRVVIEEAFPGQSPNGKNLPGIAAIQVNGSLHAQDVAASSDIAHGGDDTISTGGGDDIVVGGTGGDKITTYGDERYGIYDNDVVFGDNAKMAFTDRDNSEATASMLSMAESLDSRGIEGNYADRIITGNGNDVVVGGLGADYINSGATADADSMLDGIKVVSFNFTRENATAVEMVAGETAGVVADNDWTNLYIKNNRLHIVGENENNSDTPVKHDGVGISLVAYDTAVGNGTQNSSLMLKDDAQLDGDTSNSRLFNAYYAAQQQQEIKLTLTGLDTFRTGSELGASAACDVYVYLGGDQQGVDSYNYLFDVCGRQPGGNALDQHYYLNDWTGNHFDGDYRQVTCTDSPAKEELLSQVAPDMSLIGNYVVFRNVTSATFEVRIRNLFTDTNQWPLNLPVITAVQVVAVADREDDIAVGGDHDKDLVFGDDARVTFDIDLPFARNENLADYANRAVEAQSIHIDGNAVEIPLDGDGKPVEMGDTILTGRDRDVIVGGDFGDTITMGDGDDVALGDNASLILEHNNPVGVFAPSVEIMLEQHSVNTSNGEVFLGNDNTQASQIQSKFENGGVPGVSLVASTNGGTDTFTDVTGKDWTLQQETSSTTESGTGDSTTDSGTGDSTTDSGTEDDTTSDITVDLFYIEEPLQIQAGTKLHIVCTGIVPNPWWRPYVVIFPAGSSLPQLRYLTEDGTPGEIIQPENNEYRILIPEVSNGEVSPVIHVVSDGNGLINATMG